jgi:hypothetical protein
MMEKVEPMTCFNTVGLRKKEKHTGTREFFRCDAQRDRYRVLRVEFAFAAFLASACATSEAQIAAHFSSCCALTG